MSTLPEFRNEPLTDFSTPENKAAMELALAKVAGETGREHPLVIGGERITGLKTFDSTNPAKKDQILGTFQKGSKEHVESAIDVASTAFESWKRVSVDVRAGVLLKAAKIMRERKHEFSAVMVFEVGKTWVEADADTAEAIDFMEFYAREAYRYAGEQPIVKIESENNDLVYIPLGVGAVIPPWNFPLAIMAGMTTAGIVTGNTIVLKPSSDAPWIAWRFFELLEEAGMPAGVVNFVSGGGGEVGDPLIQHPRIRFISFTGSKEVGLHINAEAAKPREGQLWIKRVVAEMGGKDAIIVDREYANLDDAASAVVAAAFGFQGQKCSACSRAIIDEAIYDRIVPMIVEKTKALRIGDPSTADAQIGPVVNEKAMYMIKSYIDRGTSEGGTLLAGGERRPGERLLRRADGHRRRRSEGNHRAGGDLRTGPGDHQGQGFRRRAFHRERHPVRPHGRGVHGQRGEARPRARGVLRRQPVPEPQVHGCPRRCAPVRRLQYVRHRLQGRRPRLPRTVFAGQDDLAQGGEAVETVLSAESRHP